MKSKICLILDLRMPLFLADFNLLEIGNRKSYYDMERTEKSFRERYQKMIRPLFITIKELARSGNFKISVFFSGNFLQLLRKNFPEDLEELKSLADENILGLVGGSYSNTLASLYSMEVFEMDVQRHRLLVNEIFDQKPEIFMNTENIFSNSIAVELKSFGFKACFADNIPWYLKGNHPRQIFKALVKGDFNVLIMEHASGKLLENDKRDEWIFVKIIPDPETQGKDWKARLKALVRDHDCYTVQESIVNSKPKHTISAPNPIGGLARAQGMAGFTQNPMQKKSLETLFSLENAIMKSGDEKMILDWIGLSNVEYLLSLNTEKANGTRPYDIFIRYMNILTDLKIRLS